jgi:hypothetical protein
VGYPTPHVGRHQAAGAADPAPGGPGPAPRGSRHVV